MLAVTACGEELVDPLEPDPLDVDLVTREDLRSETLAKDDSVSFNEDPPEGRFDLAVLSNDRGPGLRVASHTTTDLGEVTIENGDLVLTVIPDFFGSDTIEYTAVSSDSFGTAVVVIVIRPVNDRPRRNVDSLTIGIKQVDGDTTLDISSFFSDPDGDPLTYRIDAPGSKNTFEPDPVSQELQITAGAKGPDRAFLTAIDDSLSESEPIVIEIMVGNRPPENYEPFPPVPLMVGEADTLILGDYFRDPDGDELEFFAVSDPGVVRADIKSDSLILQGESAAMEVTVTVTASDAEDEVMATVTVTVTANRPPMPAGSPVLMLDGIVGIPIALGLDSLFVDPDGDLLTFEIDTTLVPMVGSILDLKLSGERKEKLGITPKKDETGQFGIVANDGRDKGRIDIAVIVNENEPPELKRDSIAIGRDTTLNMLDFFEDPTPVGDSLFVESVDAIDDGDENITAEVSGSVDVRIDTVSAGVDTLLVRVRDRANTVEAKIVVEVISASGAYGDAFRSDSERARRRTTVSVRRRNRN